eukprot:COSAG01_NODE_14274_length_1474_cov_1.213818_2_plen_43_part_01
MNVCMYDIVCTPIKVLMLRRWYVCMSVQYSAEAAVYLRSGGVV